MALVVWLVRFRILGGVESRGGAVTALLVSLLAGVVSYGAIQAALRSPELAWLRHGLGSRHDAAAGGR
jgi:hypothetical protein